MSEQVLKIVPLSSLHKVYPDFCPEQSAVTKFSTLKNEPLSFQVAYKSCEYGVVGINVRVKTDLPISFYCIDYVPVLHTDIAESGCTRTSGLFPDILRPKAVNPKIKGQANAWQTFYFEQGEDCLMSATNDAWQSLQITVNEDAKTVAPGEYKIKLEFLSFMKNNVLAECEVKVKVIDAALPKQDLMYTNWFHCDCLCDYYNVEPFTDEFWEIFKNYVTVAAKNGMNMLLTPAFTPALDTCIGAERKTVQLVGVKYQDGKYSFDFTLLKKFVDIAKKCGIEYFEHAHFFTQWGATSAPKIMGEKDGKYQKLFGWNTKASSKAYKEFLESYIPALKEFLKQEKLEKKIFFHISDEPTSRMAPTFSKALETVGNLLQGYMQGDALSHYDLYEKGFVKTPIVVTSFVKDFYGKCDNFWVYYTGGELKDGLSNRLIINTHERNRMIGVQMYTVGAKGFLHWGYNYYYDLLSHGVYDPKINTGLYRQNPGTSYCVYPDMGGKCLQSTRQKVFGEALQDTRALKLAEKLCGRQEVDKLIKKHFGKVTFNTCPESPEQFIKFRQALNKMIEKAI